MRPELVTDDVRLIREDTQAPEPFATYIVVAFLKCETASVYASVEIREMKKAAHVEGLTNRTELLHQRVIETGEMLSLEGAHDRFRERNRAGLDRITRKLSTLDENLREDYERVFRE